VKRFFLGTNRTTAEQDKAFFAIIRSRWPHLGWWHQLSETWLFVDLTDELTPSDLRDAALQAFPGVQLLVIEIPCVTNWAGFGMTKDYQWFRETWDRTE
jgi:hypothetical protein